MFANHARKSSCRSLFRRSEVSVEHIFNQIECERRHMVRHWRGSRSWGLEPSVSCLRVAWLPGAEAAVVPMTTRPPAPTSLRVSLSTPNRPDASFELVSWTVRLFTTNATGLQQPPPNLLGTSLVSRLCLLHGSVCALPFVKTARLPRASRPQVQSRRGEKVEASSTSPPAYPFFVQAGPLLTGPLRGRDPATQQILVDCDSSVQRKRSCQALEINSDSGAQKT